MKKINTIFIAILVFSLVLTGCAGGDKEPLEKGGNNPVSAPVTQGEAKTGDGSQTNSGAGNSGKSLEIPAEFPVNILPLLDDARIEHINKNEANKGIGITFATKKTLKEAADYYVKVMKDGDVTMSNGDEKSHFIIGGKGNYAVAISITLVKGETYVLLDATPKAK